MGQNQIAHLVLGEPQRVLEEFPIRLLNELDHAVRIVPTGRDGLDHNFGRREFASRARGIKSAGLMMAIAEWFVLGMAAAAERNDRTAAETELAALRVLNREVSLDANRAVVIDCDFG